ncbi:MAG: carbohydrate binding domain-containing protein [Candidatus Nanopelagicales bacterium]|nr:carbohydrate binding domain-containing protein [Candidatus Nanopelagicales bacterium]
MRKMLRFASFPTAALLAFAAASAPVDARAQVSTDIDPPTVSEISLPSGVTGPSISVGATIEDVSGVNKAYLYLDRLDGRNEAGIRLWDDGTNGDVTPGDDRYSANAVLAVPDATYDVSLLTYDSKYNEVRPRLGTLKVAGSTFEWLRASPAPSPTPTASEPAPEPSPTSTSIPTPSPTPSASSGPPSDQAPPVVSAVEVPVGLTSAAMSASASVVDAGSGVNKVYLYFDRPDGRNAAGIRMTDDGQGADAAADDGRYSTQSTLTLGDGQYRVSILTYDGKYNETNPTVASLVVSGEQYRWSPDGAGGSPTPTPTPTASPAPSPTQTPTPTPTPTPTYPPSGTNLLVNGSFESGLAGWAPHGVVDTTNESYEGGFAARLTAGNATDARITQTISGLKPMTRYTLAFRVKTSGSQPRDVWASYGVDGDVQLAKTNSLQSAGFSESRFSFFTEPGSPTVDVWVMAGRNDPPGTTTIDSARLVEGVLPVPTPSPGEPPLASLPTPPTLPAPGDNAVTNGDFAAGGTGWVLDGAAPAIDGSGQSANPIMTVTPTATTARAVQDVPILLAPGTTYTLSARARTTGGTATIGYTATDGSVDAYSNVSSTSWQQYDVTFTTGATYSGGKVRAEFYKGNSGTLYVDDITLLARGAEWLDTPDPTPTPQAALTEDFDGPGLNSGDWLIANKGWGGDNGGVVPANVSVSDGVVHLAANGDRYEGQVVGLGGRKTRVGAAIVTRNYFASGRYEVRARVPRQEGACTAFWSFHYLEYQTGQPEYYEEPNRIRNSEIDWEFPTARDDGSDDDPISFDNARANSWGGKYGGEGGNVSLRPRIGDLVADGEFHNYAYEWHSGGPGMTPYVAWSIDGTEVARYDGNGFGQDNVPFRASRFWIGVWFPASGYKDKVGWAGNPDFDTVTLDIDSVTITPFNEPNDRYEAETWPNGFYADPGQYPGQYP